MSLEKRTYKVMIVSASDSFNSVMSALLPRSDYSPVRFFSSVSAAERDLSENDYDFVLINSPLRDDFGARFAIDVSNSQGTIALMLVKSDLHETVSDKVVPHGVFTLEKPTSRQMLETVLEMLASARERLRKTEKKTLSIEDKMQEIRLVNRAKWLLISEIKMDEPAAHRYIEKQAMDKCVTRREIAEEIIRTYGG